MFVSFLLLFAGNSIGQITLPDIAIIYRGFDLRVQIPEGKFHSLECDNCQIVHQSSYSYVIRASGQEPEILLKLLNKRGKLQDSLVVKVFDLPDPELFFGPFANGDSLDSIPRTLRVTYPSHIPLTVNYAILGGVYAVGAAGDVAFKGNIPQTFIDQLEKLPKGTRIFISLEVLGPDRLKRTVTSVFYR